MDCTSVSDTSFNQVGEPIAGDLFFFGWVVMRGLTIDPDTVTSINKMATKGAGVKGARKCIESNKKS